MNGTYKLGVTALFVMILSAASFAQSEPEHKSVDAAAMGILRSMSEFIRGLKQFSVNVVNMREDVTRSGHRVDSEVSTMVTVKRPNRMRAKRLRHLLEQEFYYDGDSITIYSPFKKIYSEVDAPGTIDETLTFARETLWIAYPAADLIYNDPYPLLTKDVKAASVIGKEMVGGVRCDHLLFSLPGVDFQIWIADRGDRLPLKYIVTDTGTKQMLSIVALLSNWNLSPDVQDSDFKFDRPKEARSIPFRTVSGKVTVRKEK